jgi:toluene monooxygenase system protein A
MERDEWLALARKLDWEPSYVDARELFPEACSGRPWLPQSRWAGWEEPFRTSLPEYVRMQAEKEAAVVAVREALSRGGPTTRLDPGWVSAVQLHSATLPLAEFAAVIGNLRAARFGRDGAWRTMALFGALDELRHTQIPLELMHDFVAGDARFDWTHRFYHSNNWVAIAARHAFDELLLCSDPIEFAIATNFVFETGFTNLQFIGLSALAEHVGDRVFSTMITSIQTDEARHSQIGRPVLEVVVAHDPEYAQALVDKWFWRSWLLFAVVTGFAMDYLTPLPRRGPSFKQFVQEWVLEQFLPTLEELGLRKPWYWDTFERSLHNYHHMVYASAYSYRATVWFDFVLPGPAERAWLRRKYPDSWDAFEPIWDRITAHWARADPGVDFAVHGTAIPTFCHLCQLVLSHGTPEHNDAVVVEHDGAPRVFCSEPCRWLFMREPERYAAHEDVVARVLAGKAPGNLVEFLTRYSGLTLEQWGKDAHGGRYPWLRPEDPK